MNKVYIVLIVLILLSSCLFQHISTALQPHTGKPFRCVYAATIAYMCGTLSDKRCGTESVWIVCLHVAGTENDLS